MPIFASIAGAVAGPLISGMLNDGGGGNGGNGGGGQYNPNPVGNSIMTQHGADVMATAAGQVGDIQATAAREASNIQQSAGNSQKAAYSPYATAGAGGLARLSDGFSAGGDFSKKFTMADATNSEAMKFALAQGKSSIENSAAARGGLLGTNAQQAGISFAENASSQYEKQAFDQFMSERNQQISGNERLTGYGAAATDQIASATGRMADADSNATLAAAGAHAGAIMQSANIQGAAFNSIGNQMGAMSNMFGLGDAARGLGGTIGGWAKDIWGNVTGGGGGGDTGPAPGGNAYGDISNNRVYEQSLTMPSLNPANIDPSLGWSI